MMSAWLDFIGCSVSPILPLATSTRSASMRLGSFAACSLAVVPCIAASSTPQVSHEVNRDLLLGGLPQIGLWQALSKQETERASGHELL